MWYDECRLCDIVTNIEQPVVGVSNCIISGVILYLTTQNLDSGEMYQKIVETFGKNVIIKQKVFYLMV